ncbi:MAG: tetratricopeptide repeat protein [Planctomycetota bacterium]
MRADVKPELSIDQEFERMLAHAIVWVRQNALVLVLSVGAAVVILAAFIVTYTTRATREQAIVEDLERAGRAPTEGVADLQEAARRAEGTAQAARALLAYADALYDAGKLDEAREAYERVLREHAGSFLALPARLALGTTLEEMG